MADDDIEKLLREIASTTGQPGAASGSEVARKGGGPPARADAPTAGGGRLAFATIAAVGMGAATFVFGVLTPWSSALDMGSAGAFSAFVVALVAGPPRWFSS